MVATIDQLIAAINPDLYFKPSEEDPIEAKRELENFKKLVKETLSSGKGLSNIAEKVKPKYAPFIFSFPQDSPLPSKDTTAMHKIVYDSSSETLEPVYFWLLDLMEMITGGTPEKLVDNFSSTVGSGHFSELGQRATIMQQQATKLLGDINIVLRSVLNLIYDLKEFKIRLQSYVDLKSEDKRMHESALLSLKQIWLDKVDIQKGNSSIKAMALGQAGFQTLLDAFLASTDEKQAESLDLNERVKRIVISRVTEFKTWLINSEEELKKRYNLEKTYLKSQVNSLKLYSRWAKPYLRYASELEQPNLSSKPDFVKAFNTIILELTLLGKSELKPRELAIQGKLPKHFKNYKGRKYYACAIVDFRFRGIPSRVANQPHYAFGGRAEITFRAYALNEDELNLLKKELENSDLSDALKLAEGATTKSMEQMQKEINEFLEEKTPEEKKQEEKSKDINPFLALIGKSGEKEKKEESKNNKKELTEIKKDDWYEKNYLRPMAGANATDTIFKLFDIYKKGHKMPSYA